MNTVETVLSYHTEYRLQYDGTMRCLAHITTPSITAEGYSLPETLHNLHDAVELFYLANGSDDVPQLVEHCVATVA